jgi:hypothetical protein
MIPDSKMAAAEDPAPLQINPNFSELNNWINALVGD